MELFTVEQAAEKWIGMIEAPSTKATPEAKADLVAKIRAATPKTIGTRYGVGNAIITVETRNDFSTATNIIKAVINGKEVR